VSSRDPHIVLDEVLQKTSPDQVLEVLNSMLRPSAPDYVLTIISNAGVHEIAKAHLHGEVYEASRGNWDASSESLLVSELRGILSELVKKLRSKQWKRVYLIPTGHPVLSLQIKAMVYRVLRLNTVDLYYKAGTYFEVDLDQRAIAIDSSNSNLQL
jgi:hypothetical protein